jgi:putative membrane protein
MPSPIAYCGTPPLPAELASSWNADPSFWLVAFSALIALFVARRSGLAPLTTRRWALAWSIAVLALASPLCRLGVALFSARALQHLVLVALVAPLLASAWPRLRARPAGAALAFAAALWLWQSPALYAATFASSAAYWGMHASSLVSATWLWAALLHERPAARALLALATSLQMGLLGALLALAPAPLYAQHLATTAPFGLSALEDQQLGGLLLWIPGCGVFVAVGLVALSDWLGSLGAERAAGLCRNRGAGCAVADDVA